MRNVKHITVAVSPELYRQTRHLAADYDTNVTDLVTYLLMKLPEALKAARYPGGAPRFGVVPPPTAPPAGCTPVQPQLTPTPSASSPQDPGPCTAPVPQYDPLNNTPTKTYEPSLEPIQPQ